MTGRKPTSPARGIAVSLSFPRGDREGEGFLREAAKAPSRLREAGVTRIYVDELSLFRDSAIDSGGISPETAGRLRNDGIAVGIRIDPACRRSSVSNSFDPTTGLEDGYDGDPFCVGKPPAHRVMVERLLTAASVADELLLTRLPVLGCVCEQCRREKGRRTWGDFRKSWAARTIQEMILSSVREVHPKAGVSFIASPVDDDDPPPEGGITTTRVDAATAAHWFDRIYVNRPIDADLLSSSAFLLFRWLAEIAGRKVAGAVLDGAEFVDPSIRKSKGEEALSSRRAEAAVEMLLAGARELIVPWRFAVDGGLDRLRDDSSVLLEATRKIPLRGVAAYVPQSAPASRRFEGMESLRHLGFPLRPTPRFPSSSRSSIFAGASLADTELPERLRSLAESGGVIHFLPEAREAISRNGWLDLTPITDVGPTPARAAEEASSGWKEARRTLLEPLGVRFDSPPGVTLHLFGNADAVVQNTGDEPAQVTLDLAGKWLVCTTSTGEMDVGKAGVNGFCTGVTTTVMPHGWVIFHRPGAAMELSQAP